MRIGETWKVIQQGFMLTLPAVPTMTMCLADTFLQIHFPQLAIQVEDYELRGGTHFYFLDDGSVAKVNKRRAILIIDDQPNVLLALFNR